MNRFILIGIFILLSIDIFGNDSLKIEKVQSDFKGISSINDIQQQIEPIENPYNDVKFEEFKPFIRKISPEKESFQEYDILLSDTTVNIINPGGFSFYEFRIKDSKYIANNNLPNLSGESVQAMQQCPVWLEKQLQIKFYELQSHSTETEKMFAELILNSDEKIKDEVAFVIANSSIQTLTDSRFITDINAIVRNAEYIYKVADSLNYVKLVEHGDYSSRNYFTTTTYRIYDPKLKDTIWSEIPYNIYYWYIVHPKMDQEGYYVKDNNNDNSGQRTYNYSWRQFIWENPDPIHDYRNVNKTTSKGTVSTIPRFGELIKSAKILWDRNKTYYPFNRPYNSSISALNIIGNWCSHALPVDVTLPRAFQPNQILMKHDGMCNEDAFLVAAACRTALIPIIYLGTWSEDHVFGSVWDETWNHFEFFRGGLSPNGNQFYGITNMLDRGSYGWKNAMVEGFRPDGYAENFTNFYADVTKFNLKVLDNQGNPVEGAYITLFASPSMNTNNYMKCGTAFADQAGNVSLNLGAEKKYLAQAYHPKYGWAPADSTKAFILNTASAVAGTTYNSNIVFEKLTIQDKKINIIDKYDSDDYGIKINIFTRNILTGRNLRDGQRSRFYYWNPDAKGLISLILCDSLNFEKFKRNMPIDAFEYIKNIESDFFYFPVKYDSTYFVIISNHQSVNFYQECLVVNDIYRGKVQSVDDTNSEIVLSPNPFSQTVSIDNISENSTVKIFDMHGQLVDNLVYPFFWSPVNLNSGVYTIIINDNDKFVVRKAVYIK